MAWTEAQWDTFLALLQHGFAARDPLADQQIGVYRVLLDAVEPAAAPAALRELVLKGQVHRPKPGEIVSRIRRDPSTPTFDEAFMLIFDARGALKARRAPGRYPDVGAMARADDAAVWERLADVHPLVAEFVRRQGLDRLRQMPVDDPDEGQWRRKELRDAWDVHVEAFGDREVTAIAAGAGREGMRQLDPLAGLPGQLADRARTELEETSHA